MAIYQRGKSWYYDFVHKGQRYAGCIGLVSRTVAKEEEARKRAAVIEGRLNPAKARKSPRFEAFAEEYLEWARTNKKPLTCERAGISPCGPHTLRHTFALRLIMAGVDPRTVQEFLGPKDIKMTLRYAHLSPDHKQVAIATLEQRFSGQKS